MKHLILALIRCYWQLVPEVRRRRCLFRETCSRYVYRETQTLGARAGVVALWRRLCACRPGFQVRVREYSFEVVCRNGTIIPHAELGTVIVEALTRGSPSLAD